jgi:hypothetical protein
MPVDRATVERALRRAHEAGDVEAARRIAQGWRNQQGQRTTAVNPQPTDILPLPGYEQPPAAGIDWGRAVGEGLGGTVGAVAGGAGAGPVGAVLGGGAGAAAGGELVDQARRFPALTEAPSALEAAFPFPAALGTGRPRADRGAIAEEGPEVASAIRDFVRELARDEMEQGE